MSISFVLKLCPGVLENPDLDLRYRLPEAIVQASQGALQSTGYTYDEHFDCILVFLSGRDERGLATIVQVLETQRFLENDLRNTPVGIIEQKIARVVHPPAQVGATFNVR